MTPITKRFMEIFIIVTALILLSLYTDLISQNPEQQYDITPNIVTLKQAIYDRYGPGIKQPYIDFFDGVPLSQPYSSDSVLLWEEIYHAIDQVLETKNAITGVPETPEWFARKIQEAYPWLDQLHAILNQGIFLENPQEEGFHSSDYQILKLTKIQGFARFMKFVALYEWGQGNRENALRYLSDIIRLGRAFRLGASLAEHIGAFHIIDIGISGFESLILNNPSAEWNRKIHETLQSFKQEEWTIPHYTENILIQYITMAANHPRAVPMSPERYAIALLYASLENKRVSEPLLFETNLLPDDVPELYETAAYLAKWTSVPAMRKRAGQLPESICQNDPLFTYEQAKSLPPLIYAAYRYIPGYGQPSAGTIPNSRFEVTRLHFQLITYACWARVWHDQNGRWLTDGDSAQDTSAIPHIQAFPWHPPFSWHETSDPEFIRNYLKTYFATSTLPITFSEDGQELIFPLTHKKDLEDTAVGYFPNASDSGQDIHNWQKGILLAADPFIQSVSYEKILETEKDGAPLNEPIEWEYYRTQLNLPKTTYWITHPGPDGVNDRMIHIYDPSNGLTSRGDLFTLVGWE
ncbi:MAG: hypothetical protein ACOX5R_08215 [bacterium]|jgi:hypothetical protein